MSKMDIEQWNEMVKDTSINMIEHVEAFTLPISRVLSSEHGEHLGSASYFESNNIKYIITNEHVAKHSKKHVLTHKFYNNDNILKIRNSPTIKKPPIDVAIFKIDDESWNYGKHDAVAIPIERFALSHSPVEREMLFFAGFSGERSNFVFNTLSTPGTPYLTQESEFPESVEGADSKIHFSLLYAPDKAESLDGRTHLPDPHGFSGSLVWDTKRVKCMHEGIDWSPELAEVTGIVWGWPSSSACILVTKVEHMQLNKLIHQDSLKSIKNNFVEDGLHSMNYSFIYYRLRRKQRYLFLR